MRSYKKAQTRGNRFAKTSVGGKSKNNLSAKKNIKRGGMVKGMVVMM